MTNRARRFAPRRRGRGGGSAGAALALAEARQRTTIDTIAEGIVVYDFDDTGRYFPVLMNPAAIELTGNTPSRMREMTASRIGPVELVDDDGNPIGLDDLPVALVARTGQATTAVYGMRNTEGEPRRWLRTAASPVLDERGAMVGIVSSLVDVSAERAAVDRAEADRARFAALAEEASASERAWRESEQQFRTAFEHAPIGMALAGLDGRYKQANRALSEMTGYSRDELQRLRPDSITHPDDLAADAIAIAALLSGEGTSYALEKRYLTATGEVVWAAKTVSLVRRADGSPLHFIAHIQDITERKDHEQALTDERRRLRAAQSIGRVGSWEWDVLTGSVTWSDTLYRLCGLDPADGPVDHSTAMSNAHAADSDEVDAAIQNCRRTGDPFYIRYRWIRPNDGELRWFDTRGEAIYRNGRVALVGGAVADVTEQVQAERALADSEAQFRMAFERSPIGITMVDLQEGPPRILRANAAVCDFIGRSEADLRSLDLLAILHPDDRAANQLMIDQLRAGQDEVDSEKRWCRADGATVWGHLVMAVVSPTDGSEPYGICMTKDITARKDAEAALVHQSLHDPLTGLANRALLHDRIEHALAGTDRSHRSVGVLYIDLDGFKAVNDSAGHAAGDQLLVQVAERLCRASRPGDTLARVGGDEFAIVCVDLADDESMPAIATRVLATLRAPFSLQSGVHHISASIGLATSDDSSGTEELLAAADAAMYEAKNAGKDRFARTRAEAVARAVTAARLLPELHDALDLGQLIMYGQPVVDLATGATVAVETLLRWNHPARGILPPGAFLDAAEHSPLMVTIGRRALDESCRMAAAWSEELGPAAPDLHVNVSGRQMETGHLVADVAHALDTYGLPASRVILELTETHMPVITDTLLADLDTLRARGVRIAIDDLGTGHSSLARITELPVDILKIDLKFTAGLGRDVACDAVVRAILSLGQAMGLAVVAEGVETAQQAELLRAYGCDTVQGYLYSRPRAEEDLLLYLREQCLTFSGTGASPRFAAAPVSHK